jgi:hypothetical protein
VTRPDAFRNLAPASLVYPSVSCRTLFACLALPALCSSLAVAGPADPPSSNAVPIVLLRRSDKTPPSGSGADVLVRAKPAGDEIARRAAAMLAAPGGFGQQVLRLDRFVRAYLLQDPKTPAERREALTQPAFLFLSDREGGYPAESFWLEEPDGRLKEMRDVTFVDMTVDERDLTPGRIDGLQEIYAHELGHLMMAALAGPAPKRASTAMHFVTTRTDSWYAFTEGFGEHFQPVSLDWQRDVAIQATRVQAVPESERTWYGRFVREQVEGCVICPANLRFLRWQGAREQRFRDVPLRANQFVLQPPLPTPLVDGSRPSFESRLYRDLAVAPPGGALKNGVQMMESEGVIATLFYRLVNDPRLRGAYREPGFYEPFLDASQATALRESGPPAVVTPVDNVYLKLFDVMHRTFAWGEWPAVEFVAGYARRFPDEAAAVYDVFLDVTRGVTVDREAATRHREPGYLAELRDRLLAGRAALDSDLGPAIWMNAPSMTFGLGVYRYFVVPSSFTFDLNAADVPDLLTVPGVDPHTAAAIVAARGARGHFAGVDDLAAIPGVSAELQATFRSMAEKMRARMERSEPRRAESGWFKNVMVPLLRASYYVAAAWQFGVAIMLAGLAFSATGWAAGRVVAGRASSLPGRTDVPGVAGQAAPRRSRRGWFHRGLRGLLRGAAVATVPCAASVAIYAAGILPSAANMTLVGLSLGAPAVLVRVLFRRPSATAFASLLQVLVPLTAASAVIGLMY